MKVLIFGNKSLVTHKRGIENVILSQLKIYSNYNIYYFHWGDKDSVYKLNNLICFSINNNSFWVFRFNFILKRLGNDLFIHSHNPLFSLFAFLKTNILTVHDGLYYMAKSSNKRLANLFYVLEKCLYKRVDKVLFISDFTKQQSLYDGSEGFRIIHNSSHLENINYSFNKDFKLSNYILIVKNIEERARIDLIIQVAVELPKCIFIIAGKGPLSKYYSDLIEIKKIKNIKMLGFVDDELLINLYSHSKFVINLAEYGEGFGLPIIESYLFNKPVIASKVCAIPEIIIDKNHLVNNLVGEIIDKIDYFTNELNFDSEIYKNYYFNNFSSNVINSKTMEFVNSTLKVL